MGRASTVFTTHTPVPAGIDRFPRTLVEQYFGESGATPGVPVDQLLALGTEDYAGGDPTVFNMAVMGFRLAQRANGVSQLHGHVSREMFNGLWPAFDEAEVPIGSITNGVHAPTWVAREIFDLARLAGRRHPAPTTPTRSGRRSTRCRATRCGRSSDSCASGSSLDARRRLAKSWQQRGTARAELGWIDSALDPDVLTIGFARRVPSYKRLTLMMRDPERLKALLLHPERPIQLVIAGKAHPADDGGKKLIQEIVKLADDPEIRHRIVFLPNYDIAMAQPLYPGCDVWLNNPLRPYEACGTSGMKAALNGGLNLSILDGWWDEWYDGDNGWAIPSADGVEDLDKRDDLEAAALYDLIENEVAPRFYDRDERRRADPLAGDGPPHAEVARPQGARDPDGPRLRAQPLRPGRRQRPAAQLRLRRAPPSWPPGRSGSRPPGRRCASSTSSPTASATPPRSARSLTVRAFVCARRLRPDDVEVQVVHGKIDSNDVLDRHRPSRTWSSPRATTAAGTASTPTSSSTAAARSATPSGSSRATSCSPRSPSWESSRSPELGVEPQTSRSTTTLRPSSRIRSPVLTGVPIGSLGSVDSTTSPAWTQSLSGSSTWTTGRRS